MAVANDAEVRLETWKEVAAFFRKDERTVKRWEVDRGLPIRRYPGASRSRIFAIVSELEAWRDGAASVELEAPAATPASQARRPPRGLWIALASLVVVTGVAGAGLVGWRAAERARPPPLEAQKLFVAGREDWARRTPESLTRAIGEYDAAIARDPDYAEAYAGLASAYDLMREYTRMPPSQAYPLAVAAAKHAIQLDDGVADAHTALAFAEYWGFWNATAARREFSRSISLEPRSSTSQHWYATFLSATGDQKGALQHIEVAQSLDPQSQVVAADRGLILMLAGRDTESLAVLKELERKAPEFSPVHAYLAEYDLIHGDFAAYIVEARRVADLTGDAGRLAVIDRFERGLASDGRQGFLDALIEARLVRFRDGQATAYSVAEAYAVAGDHDKALAFLSVSLERRETNLMAARSNRLFSDIRSRPEFAEIMARATPLDAT